MRSARRPTDIPGGWDTCALCPRLCRPACPVASGGQREAAVPAVIAGVLHRWARGQADDALAAEAATLCTDCGACQSHCHLDRPLPELLRRARAELLPMPPVEPLQPITGDGDLVAIEADERPLAAALSARLGVPVRRWRTSDRLGVAAVEHPAFEERLDEIRARVALAPVVVVDGGVARVLAAAGVAYKWLHEAVDCGPFVSSCRAPGEARPAACCGAGGPLAAHHPEDAARVGAFWIRRGPGEPERLADARCAAHLRAAGADVADPLDVLLKDGGRS